MTKAKVKAVKKAVKYETVYLNDDSKFNDTLINVRRNIDNLIAQYGKNAQLAIEVNLQLDFDENGGAIQYGANVEYSIKKAK